MTRGEATDLAWEVGQHLMTVLAFGAVFLLGLALVGMVRR